MTEVSVVIPTHDRRDLLRRAIRSAAEQTDVDVEVEVVDDGSRTPAVVPEGIRLLRHDHPRGAGEARNTGVAAASDAWIALLDDDDVWAPDKLRRQLDAAAAAEAGFAYAGALHLDEAGTVLDRRPAPAPAELRATLRRFNVLPTTASNVVVRRELLQGLGGLDGGFAHLADRDLALRLAARSTGAAVHDDLVGYVQHAAAQHVADVDGIEEEFLRLDRKHADSGLPGSLDVAAMHGWVAENHRIGGRRVRAAAHHARAFRLGARRGAYRAVRALLAPAGGATRRSAEAAPPWVAPALAE